MTDASLELPNVLASTALAQAARFEYNNIGDAPFLDREAADDDGIHLYILPKVRVLLMAPAVDGVISSRSVSMHRSCSMSARSIGVGCA
jgi:hypothetical protein